MTAFNKITIAWFICKASHFQIKIDYRASTSSRDNGPTYVVIQKEIRCQFIGQLKPFPPRDTSTLTLHVQGLCYPGLTDSLRHQVIISHDIDYVK